MTEKSRESDKRDICNLCETLGVKELVAQEWNEGANGEKGVDFCAGLCAMNGGSVPAEYFAMACSQKMEDRNVPDYETNRANIQLLYGKYRLYTGM